MHRRSLIAGFIAGVAVAAPAAADVTSNRKSAARALAATGAGDSTQYIKGERMRTDQAVGGTATTIVDTNAQQMIVLNHKRREAMM